MGRRSTLRLDIGRDVEYERGVAWQRRNHQRVLAARETISQLEAIALLEHRPVYTLGRRADGAHILASQDEIAARGASVARTDRGGDVTFHGPGQLVVYPVLDLRARRLGAIDYVRLLEECAIKTLASFQIEGIRDVGRPGVWTEWRGGLAKVAAVGVRITHGISLHGLALNYQIDLEWFEAIVPCGIPDARVASLHLLRGRDVSFEETSTAFGRAFEDAFQVHLDRADSSGLMTGAAA